MLAEKKSELKTLQEQNPGHEFGAKLETAKAKQVKIKENWDKLEKDKKDAIKKFDDEITPMKTAFDKERKNLQDMKVKLLRAQGKEVIITKLPIFKGIEIVKGLTCNADPLVYINCWYDDWQESKNTNRYACELFGHLRGKCVETDNKGKILQNLKKTSEIVADVDCEKKKLYPKIKKNPCPKGSKNPKCMKGKKAACPKGSKDPKCKKGKKAACPKGSKDPKCMKGKKAIETKKAGGDKKSKAKTNEKAKPVKKATTANSDSKKQTGAKKPDAIAKTPKNSNRILTDAPKKKKSEFKWVYECINYKTYEFRICEEKDQKNCKTPFKPYNHHKFICTKGKTEEDRICKNETKTVRRECHRYNDIYWECLSYRMVEKGSIGKKPKNHAKKGQKGNIKNLLYKFYTANPQDEYRVFRLANMKESPSDKRLKDSAVKSDDGDDDGDANDTKTKA